MMRRFIPNGCHVSWIFLCFLFLTVSACGTDVRVIVDEQLVLDEACFEEGRCECRNDADCTDADKSICVDGQCEVRVIYLDGGTNSDAMVDGCGARDPEPEQCNGRDDDCDTLIDEDYKGVDGLFSTAAHCGQCGLDCTELIPNLQTDADGDVLDGAVACRVDGDVTAGTETYRCEPVLCADGFAPFFDDMGHAVVCLPRTAANCQPCVQAADCGSGVGHVCQEVGRDGMYCLQYCDANAGDPACTGNTGAQDCCSNGFTCTAQGDDAVCLPDSESCRCSSDNVGLTRTCSESSSTDGTVCLGIETCEEVAMTTPPIAVWSSVCDTEEFTSDICDGKDNNCNGDIDEDFTDAAGDYTLDAHCGTCGNDCALRWTNAIHHASGVCDASAGPGCVIDACTSDFVGGGTRCLTNSDCAGNAAGTTCHPTFHQCVKTCTQPSDCSGTNSFCSAAGECSVNCASGGTPLCQSVFGSDATCKDGACVTQYDWLDIDGLDLNGCECPAVATGEDAPEWFPDYPNPVSGMVLDRDCDGIDGDIERALFVSMGGTGDGTFAAPMGSVQAAIDAFGASVHRHILVSTGTYEERVVLKNNVMLHGGYSADFTGHDLTLYPTVLQGPAPNFQDPNPEHGVVVASGINQPTLLTGFVIQGYDVAPSDLGESTYAVYIHQSTNALSIVNNEIRGGRAGDGQSGTEGIAGNPGSDGANGLEVSECTDTDCVGQSKPGGNGGTNSACNTGANGCPGMEADTDSPQRANNAPNGCTYADGGAKSTYSGSGAQYCKYDCQIGGPGNGPSGGNGATGNNGNGGNGCAASAGTVVGVYWVGSTAQNGTPGTNGSGGQGGSAGGWVENNKDASCTIGNRVGDLGGSGGGGGAGGCGGARGNPGSSGGGSFAVWIIPNGAASTPVLKWNVILRGVGGDGGAGGAGGPGGQGGEGGLGGATNSVAWCASLGGAGGSGGYGGDGGGGGGGCGGVSFGIAGVGIGASSNTYTSENTFNIADGTNTGGLGGVGGYAPGASAGDSGQNGASENVYVY